jgi:hypothetical protein
MADDAPRTLLCLIEGESSLFIVILAKDLTLWKVMMTMPAWTATAPLTLPQVER